MDWRCKTFDARANGYVRSEGVGALLLRPRPSSGRGAPVDRAVVGGSAVRQDGRSASLTAPNGSAQRVLLLAAHASAAEGAAAFGLALVEAHGTGTPLGDPTEAGALAAAVGGGGAASVLVGAAKGSVGHAEAASGLLGLLRAADALERACASANAQLRAVNPLVAERARAARRVALALCAQRCGAAAGDGGMCGGVSSFGFSGTIAHVRLRSGPLSRCAVARRLHPLFSRGAFLWASHGNPLCQLRSSDTPIQFRSQLHGPLFLLVADHTIQGEVVFPGAGYLEMMRAVAAAAVPAGSNVTLQEIFFLQPLVLSQDGSVECTLTTQHQLEVRSYVDSGASLHCTAGLQREGVFSSRAAALSSRRACHTEAVDPGALYGAMSSAGLEYGPGFRQLQQVWASHDGSACSRLACRRTFDGTCLHPADLDAALQLTFFVDRSSTSSVGETRLPFALDAALLCGSRTKHRWAVRFFSSASPPAHFPSSHTVLSQRRCHPYACPFARCLGCASRARFKRHRRRPRIWVGD